MSSGIVTASYIIAAILFILSLGGLSHPETARRGNIYGVSGMLIAVVATIFSADVYAYSVLLLVMVAGATVGLVVARRVQMTEMPELVAILHSFVGLAAVLIGYATYIDGFGVLNGPDRLIHEIEIYLGVLIGAVTFTGSVVAFGKLRGLIDGKPLLLPARHWLNLALGVISVWLCFEFVGIPELNRGVFILRIMTALAFAFAAAN